MRSRVVVPMHLPVGEYTYAVVASTVWWVGSGVPVGVPVEGVNMDVAANGAHDVQAQGSGSVPVALSLGVREVEVFAGGSWGRPGSGGGIFFGESVELLRPSDFLEVRGSDANCVPLDYGVGGVKFVWVGVPKPV